MAEPNKPTAVPQAVPAAAARMTPAPAPLAPLVARFRQPKARDTEKRGTNVVAHCDISGMIAALPHVSVLDFALALNRDREMIVYMPGYGSTKSVGVPQLDYTGGKLHKSGRDITPKTVDDARYLDELTALQDAIVDAWARANSDKTKQPWGRDIALKIATPEPAATAATA